MQLMENARENYVSLERVGRAVWLKSKKRYQAIPFGSDSFLCRLALSDFSGQYLVPALGPCEHFIKVHFTCYPLLSLDVGINCRVALVVPGPCYVLQCLFLLTQ